MLQLIQTYTIAKESAENKVARLGITISFKFDTQNKPYNYFLLP